jgi:TonB family protein
MAATAVPRTSRRLALALTLVIAGGASAGLAGCGGGAHGDTTPGPAASAASRDASADMVPPDTIDQITRSLMRKREAMVRCFTLAVDSKELAKAASGKLTVDLVISPSGQVSEARIAKSSLESKALEDCVISRVKEIQFPALPRPYPTSYTYGFEAI